jgi:hypothetical protein
MTSQSENVSCVDAATNTASESMDENRPHTSDTTMNNSRAKTISPNAKLSHGPATT